MTDIDNPIADKPAPVLPDLSWPKVITASLDAEPKGPGETTGTFTDHSFGGYPNDKDCLDPTVGREQYYVRHDVHEAALFKLRAEVQRWKNLVHFITNEDANAVAWMLSEHPEMSEEMKAAKPDNSA